MTGDDGERIVWLKHADVEPIYRAIETIAHIPITALEQGVADAACLCEDCYPAELMRAAALKILVLSDALEGRRAA